MHVEEARAMAVEQLRELAPTSPRESDAELARARAAALVEYSDDAIIGTSLDGAVTTWNSGAERIFGWSALEMIGQPVSMLIPPEEQEKERSNMQRLARGELLEQFDTVRIARDGRRIELSVRFSAVRDRTGAVVGASKIARDITPQRQAERDLARFCFDLSVEMLCVADFDGNFVRLNPAWEKTLGFSQEEFLAHPFVHFVHPDDRAATLAAVTSLRSDDGVGAIFENRYRHRDGTYRWLRWSSIAMPGRGLIYSMAHDITVGKLAEAALRKNEAQLQTIVENIDEGVAVSDLDGQLLHFNRAALEMHGYASLEESRRHLSEFADTFELSGMDGAVWPVDQWPLARILRGEKLRCLEVRIRRIQTNRKRIFSYGGTLVHDARGEPLMAVVTISDITERKLAADVIRQLNTDLEQRVAERTVQLQTANNELEAFSYSVSHDLRAPLRSLDGFSQALMEDCLDKLDPENQDNLRRIRNASQRMGHLIDDLLNLSHLTRAEMSRQAVDLSKIAQEVTLELRAGDPGREVKVVIAEGIVAEADPRLLRIALTNLFANAWKFTAKRADARIDFGCAGEDGNRVFFVRDNGVGFDMAHAKKLFGAFQRLHAMQDFPGSGIGLVTVQRIIHRHGGRIWAESAVEAGATFHFTL